MKTVERDRFLTEYIGECYHNYEKVIETDSWDEQSACECIDYECSKCGDYQSNVLYRDFSGCATRRENYWDFGRHGCFIDFDSWDGMGKLYNHCKSKIWWTHFVLIETKLNPLLSGIIEPTNFSNAIYNYLKKYYNFGLN